MIYKLSPEQIKWCMDLAIKRSGTHNHAETKNSINCFKNKAGWYRHYLGVLGELAYSIHSGLKIRPFTGEADNGTDFDNGVDVKASDTKYKPNLLLFEKQFKKDPSSAGSFSNVSTGGVSKRDPSRPASDTRQGRQDYNKGGLATKPKNKTKAYKKGGLASKKK